MRNLFFNLTYGALICVLLFSNLSLREQLAENQYAQTKVYYSGNSEADQALVEAIQSAKQYVYFAVYTLTKENIAKALIAAKLRGLDVRGVLDFNQAQVPQEKPWITKMKKYGIVLEIPEKQDGLVHVKMLVTDNAYASGSFNYTVSAAAYNDEVLEIGRVEGIRKQYLQIFQILFKKYKTSLAAG